MSSLLRHERGKHYERFAVPEIKPKRASCAASHPLLERPKHTFAQIADKLCAFYGVADAERWYAIERRAILDSCKPDPLGIRRFETLKEYWEAKQMESKWNTPIVRVDEEASASPSKHCVELYKVRGPGANGEIGVLTTTTDIAEFIAGLAAATSDYLRETGPDSEQTIHWILRNATPIAFKLAGYKADKVIERHVLMCGSSAPASDDIVATDSRR